MARDPNGKSDLVGASTAQTNGLGPRPVAGEQFRTLADGFGVAGEPSRDPARGIPRAPSATEDRIAEALARLAEDR